MHAKYPSRLEPPRLAFIFVTAVTKGESDDRQAVR